MEGTVKLRSSVKTTPITKNDAKARIQNKGSMLLTIEENEELFRLLESEQYAICSGIVRVLKANKLFSPGWEQVGRGVLVYIKDYGRKLYCLRLYCLPTKRFIWEQILYTNFMPVFGFERNDTLEFEGDDTIYCLNFAHQAEAQLFYEFFRKKFDKDNNCEVIKDNISTIICGQISNTMSNGTSTTSMDKENCKKELVKKGSIKIDNKKKKGKINKDEISTPSNFSHLVHIGWSKSNGISDFCNDNGSKIDDSVKILLKAAGFDYKRMKEKDLEFAKSFVEEYERKERLSRMSLMGNTGIPLATSTPSVKFENISLEMSKTSLQQVKDCSDDKKNIPMPPPLPLVGEKPLIPKRRVIDRSFDKLNTSMKNDMIKNEDLLAQIKQGKQLNHVDRESRIKKCADDEDNRGEQVVNFNDSLAIALRKTMNERRKNIDFSDTESSSTTNSDEWQ
uniref:WH1 domain-containing protein n=1 Tax=Parastrongyloides trichosuri TaxID=131310 RepID=A0A0N4ZEM8_PARTI